MHSRYHCSKMRNYRFGFKRYFSKLESYMYISEKICKKYRFKFERYLFYINKVSLYHKAASIRVRNTSLGYRDVYRGVSACFTSRQDFLHRIVTSPALGEVPQS